MLRGTGAGSGFAATPPVCDGTPQPYTIDVGGGSYPFPGGASGVFKPGKASAQVTASVCTWDQFPNPCSTMSTDAIIRLSK